MDFPLEDAYTDFLNRLRIKTDIDMGDYASAVFEYDIDWRFGDFAGSLPFEVSSQVQPTRFFNLEKVLLEENDFYASHSINRAFIVLSFSHFEVKAGRYVIDWGSGRAWNPSDPFYPLNPLLPEREDRIGADALGVEIFTGEMTSFSGVVAGKGKRGEAVKALRYRTILKGTELALASFYDGEFSAGIDMSRTLLDAEFHVSARFSGDGNFEWAGGVDRAFPGSLKLGAEYYRNSGGNADRDRYNWLELLGGREQFLARDYLFGWMDYEITPLFRCQVYSLSNLNDGGLYVNPLLKYSMTVNTECELGYVHFRSDKEDEFSLYPDTAYLKFQWYF